jgi:protein SCO1/2
MTRRLYDFIVGGSFPAIAISVLVCWVVLLIGILMIPPAPTALGAFAEDFRIWCFGYDPATGRTEWAYVMAMVLPQLMLCGFILLFWWEPLRMLLRRPVVATLHAGFGVLVVAGSAAGFAFSSAELGTGELPFPAEDLRTSMRAPEVSLINQDGEPIDVSELRGHVVLLTAVYASCGHTCPMILQQTKASVAEIDESLLPDLRVIAVTMDPENDSSDVLSMLAENHGIETPLYHLLTGQTEEVERTLDRMQIARSRNPETGVIEHVNLFLLIDREGKLAYRLGLGERQQRWLTTALRVLLNETPASS